MRQVPHHAQSSLLILGTGRLAQHLQFYFDSLQGSPHAPHRVQVASLPARGLTKAALQSPTHIWIAVSDKAVESVYREARALAPQSAANHWLYSAGSLTLPQDCEARLAHPLMLFPAGHFYEPNFYRRVPLITTIERDATEALSTLGLTNPVFRIRQEDQPLYHALCVLLSNLPYTLWSSLEKQASQHWDLPREALAPILEKTVEAFAARGTSGATGPWVRNDQATIEKHRQALSTTDLGNIYEAGLALFQKGGLSK